MTKKDIEALLKNLTKDYSIYAPTIVGGQSVIEKVENAANLDYSGKIPLDPWKFLFYPPAETLFSENFTEKKGVYPRLCAWGMNIFDLKALGLLDLVFKDDPRYQQRRDHILVVGLSAGSPSKVNYEEFQSFNLKLEENILEHVPFDIFLESHQGGEILIYSGSVKGRKVLENNNFKNFENIQFAGLISEEGPDALMLELKKIVENSGNNAVWNELNKKCLACGKCSLVCPTCFCYDLEDEVTAENTARRRRLWGNCFYPEFTAIAGGYDFTSTVKERIKFWYDHKFIRIPKEYRVPGCVGCLRCAKVCPAGINIVEVLQRLKSGKKSNPGRQDATKPLPKK